MSISRLDEIISKLNIKHGTGGKLTPQEYQEKQCKTMNEATGSLNEKDDYNCEICKNKGVIYFLDDKNYLTSRNCKCMNIRRTLRRAKESGLGNTLIDCTFDKYIATEEWQKEIKSKAQAFCKDNTSNCFYIGGQTGAGKTHICTAIAGQYIKQGKECRYMLWRDYAVKLKQLVNDYTEYQRLIQEFKNADVLYIDDLFKSQNGVEPTKADINIAFELINNRMLEKDKITIISSEFEITEALKFDEAIFGRIYQKTGNYKIGIKKDIHKNYRLRG